ncbi:MAG: hypothetical protein JSV49_01110 [Thermoplasmata archaeon]|nr:MAG: hypothetical protein JSV49_01110 [Thermoplasmata archaeon]
MRYYLFMLLFLLTLSAGCVRNDTNGSSYTPAINMVGFSVVYPDGWGAHTYFYPNLTVQGGHKSGGEKPFLHLVEDNLSEELWELFYKLAERIRYQEIRQVKMDSNEPVYKIHISYDNGQTDVFETYVGQKYDNQSLDDLAYLLQQNERIYSHQKKSEWIYK